MYNFLSFQIHGGADHGGSPAEALDSLLGFLEGLAGLSPGGLFAAMMPGVSAMANIHPLLVHFPIAFLLGFFVLEVAADVAKKPLWHSVASALLYLGTVAAGFTVLAGFIAADTVPHGDNVHEIMEHHEHLGVAVLSLAGLLSLWRQLGGALKGLAKGLFLGTAAFMCLLLGLGADLGGLMVYHYGVAVAAAPLPASAAKHVHADGHGHEDAQVHEAAPPLGDTAAHEENAPVHGETQGQETAPPHADTPVHEEATHNHGETQGHEDAPAQGTGHVHTHEHAHK